MPDGEADACLQLAVGQELRPPFGDSRADLRADVAIVPVNVSARPAGQLLDPVELAVEVATHRLRICLGALVAGPRRA